MTMIVIINSKNNHSKDNDHDNSKDDENKNKNKKTNENKNTNNDNSKHDTNNHNAHLFRERDPFIFHRFGVSRQADGEYLLVGFQVSCRTS